MILEHSAQLLEARVSTNADATKKTADEDEDDLMSVSDVDAEVEEVPEGNDEEDEKRQWKMYRKKSRTILYPDCAIFLTTNSLLRNYDKIRRASRY